MSIIIEILYEESDSNKVDKIIDKVLKASIKLGVQMQICKRDLYSHDTLSRFGILLSPTIVVNGIPMIIGREPTQRELEDILKRSLLQI